MEDMHAPDEINFNLPKNQSSVIKVLGVGGGGSNAVNYMYDQGTLGVDFVVTNTDAQHLENSPVPNKIQLGVSLTEGLGAGANPEIGEKAAQESIEEVQALLQNNTKMLFITAGMGGGTGTGAAPVIAKAAMDMGILTVGIVTIPFSFEGKAREQQAQKGLESLRANVDALVVINNNKLREVYGNLGYKAGFAKADEVLATASRGIAEVITHHYTANIDLRDAKTVLANSGTAIMGSATATGENRATEAIVHALDSPLLNDNHIRGAKHVLLLIVSGDEEITIDEIGEINEHIQKEAGGGANIIMGIGDDNNLGHEIGVTVIATGFNAEQEVSVIGAEPQKIIHPLDEDQPVSQALYHKEIQWEETETEDHIEQTIARAERQRKEQHIKQTSLFEETPKPQEEQPKTEPTEAPLPRQTRVQHEEEIGPLPQPQSQKEIEEPEDAPLFEVDFDTTDEVAEERANMEHAGEPQEPPQKAENQGETNEHRPRKYDLQDYLKVEEQLKNSKPAPKPSEKEEETEESLRFEVKEVSPKKEETPNASRPVDPLNSTIEESRYLKGEERRKALKAFNYRFRNATNLTDELEAEPAYKRQGVRIDHDKYSEQQVQGRYTIEDTEDEKASFKNNNRFLHDNVD